MIQGSTTPIAGLTVRGCAQLDLDCTAPLATSVSDSNGEISLALPQYFRGYLALEPPPVPDAGLPEAGSGDASVDDGGEAGTGDAGEAPRFMRGRFYFLPPKGEDTPVTPINIPMVHQLRLIAGSIGAKLDFANYGFGSTAMYDCNGKRTADIEVKLSAVSNNPEYPTTIGYVSATGAISVTPAYTSPLGGAGIFNVPPGPNTVTTNHVKLGKKTGGYTVIFRAGEMTLTGLPPTP